MPDLVLAVKTLSVVFVPLLLGVILHELAHGLAAERCGDDTARREGRLTLNPLAHVDGAGLTCFVLTALLSPITLGWAKPVPIDPGRFRRLTADMAKVALAGPLANFILAAIFALALRLLLLLLPYREWQGNGAFNFLFLMLFAGISVNLALGWFNLLPLPPLDGSRLVWCVLPPRAGWIYMRLERFGLPIVLLLAATNILGVVLGPLIETSVNIMLGIVGLK